MDVYLYETHFDTPFVPALFSILILFKTRLFATRYLFSHQKEKGTRTYCRHLSTRVSETF